MDHQLGESTELMSSMKGGEGQAVGLSLVNPLWYVVELTFEASRGRPLGVSKVGPTIFLLKDACKIHLSIKSNYFQKIGSRRRKNESKYTNFILTGWKLEPSKYLNHSSRF